MKEHYKENIEKYKADPKFITTTVEALDALFANDKKYQYHIDIVEDTDMGRIELTSEDTFTASGYMDKYLLYYCIRSFINLFLDKDARLSFFMSNPEYMLFPDRSISGGVDKMYDVIMNS